MNKNTRFWSNIGGGGQSICCPPPPPKKKKQQILGGGGGLAPTPMLTVQNISNVYIMITSIDRQSSKSLKPGQIVNTITI